MLPLLMAIILVIFFFKDIPCNILIYIKKCTLFTGHIASYNIPVLPASPYRVNSPNAEPLWPEGLFVPPSLPVHYPEGKPNSYLPDHLDNGNNFISITVDNASAVLFYI